MKNSPLIELLTEALLIQYILSSLTTFVLLNKICIVKDFK